MSALAVLINLIVVFAFYMIPTICAYTRKHNNMVPIGLTNLLLGWTGIFWIGALIWSFTDNTSKVEKSTA